MAEAPSHTHNKRSLIQPSHVCHRHLAVGKFSSWKIIKTHTHTYTRTHINTHTNTNTQITAKNETTKTTKKNTEIKAFLGLIVTGIHFRRLSRF